MKNYHAESQISHKALIKKDLNFLNLIKDKRFGEIGIWQNAKNQQEFVMSKEKVF